MTTMAEVTAPDRLRDQEIRNLRAEVERLRAALAERSGSATVAPKSSRVGPDPCVRHPLRGDETVVFLANVIERANIAVGDYTYFAGDKDEAIAFESCNVLFQTSDTDDRLVIGKFCSIASGVRFLMNGANHPDAGSTFPFWMFGKGWHERREPRQRGPIVVGNDVWIGLEALILPGVTIGDGAVIGARAVVTHDVPPYAVFVGNPARLLRQRYDDATIAKLLAMRWWDWSPERITRNLREIVDGRWDDVT
ncbi:MAG: CatB-related O-acetyltransferase [Phycisphaerae bacterium]|nr:CatB-related O-acetyltransferase [Phycisphaerae bacterium]